MNADNKTALDQALRLVLDENPKVSVHVKAWVAKRKEADGTTRQKNAFAISNAEKVMIVGDPSNHRTADFKVGPISDYKKLTGSMFWRFKNSNFTRVEINTLDKNIDRARYLWQTCFEKNYAHDYGAIAQFLDLIGVQKSGNAFSSLMDKAASIEAQRQVEVAAVRYTDNPSYGLF